MQFGIHRDDPLHVLRFGRIVVPPERALVSLRPGTVTRFSVGSRGARGGANLNCRKGEASWPREIGRVDQPEDEGNRTEDDQRGKISCAVDRDCQQDHVVIVGLVIDPLDPTRIWGSRTGKGDEPQEAAQQQEETYLAHPTWEALGPVPACRAGGQRRFGDSTEELWCHRQGVSACTDSFKATHDPCRSRAPQKNAVL